MKSWDVIVIGGGIIGLTLSLELRKRGAAVLVLERGEPGREASQAAGGMLVDCGLETPAPLQALATASARMYPEFARQLQIESGINVDLRDQGTIFFQSPAHTDDPALPPPLSPVELRELEPALAENDPEESDLQKKARLAFYLEERSVDPRALVLAALAAAKRLGVDVSSGEQAIGVNATKDGVDGVTTQKTFFSAPKVVNCAGAWSGQIAPYRFPARPVKGQMLCLLSPSHGFLKHVIRAPEVYLIPRSDGRILAGTTVEEAGFDKRTDVATIQRLHQAAISVVPALRNAKILEDWAGLRPGTPDALPILGGTETPGYYVATGHFRDGILLAPITAWVMAQVIDGGNPEFDLEAFSPERFSL